MRSAWTSSLNCSSSVFTRCVSANPKLALNPLTPLHCAPYRTKCLTSMASAHPSDIMLTLVCGRSDPCCRLRQPAESKSAHSHLHLQACNMPMRSPGHRLGIRRPQEGLYRLREWEVNGVLPAGFLQAPTDRKQRSCGAFQMAAMKVLRQERRLMEPGEITKCAMLPLQGYGSGKRVTCRHITYISF